MIAPTPREIEQLRRNGELAHKRGAPHTRNPYAAKSWEWREWARGWLRAESKRKQRGPA